MINLSFTHNKQPRKTKRWKNQFCLLSINQFQWIIDNKSHVNMHFIFLPILIHFCSALQIKINNILSNNNFIYKSWSSEENYTVWNVLRTHNRTKEKSTVIVQGEFNKKKSKKFIKEKLQRIHEFPFNGNWYTE